MSDVSAASPAVGSHLPALLAPPLSPLTPRPAHPRLIAFAGFAGSGKDEAAWNLTQQGYIRHNIGDVIKAIFDPFTTGRVPLSVFAPQLRAMRTWNDTGDLDVFVKAVLAPYAAAGHSVSAFTEDRPSKALVRRILEEGGDVIYREVARQYNSELDRFARPARVVNTRMCRVEEAQAWRSRGGVTIEVVRPGQDACSAWDRKTVDDLRAAGLIDHTILNTSPTGSHWRAVDAPAALARTFRSPDALLN